MQQDSNSQIFDRYSFVHASVGSLFALGQFGAPVAIGSHVLFEMLENEIKLRSKQIWPDSRADGIQNHLGDIASFIVGYYGGRALLNLPRGSQAVTILILLGAGIWTYNVAKGHNWKTPPPVLGPAEGGIRSARTTLSEAIQNARNRRLSPVQMAQTP